MIHEVHEGIIIYYSRFLKVIMILLRQMGPLTVEPVQLTDINKSQMGRDVPSYTNYTFLYKIKLILYFMLTLFIFWEMDMSKLSDNMVFL